LTTSKGRLRRSGRRYNPTGSIYQGSSSAAIAAFKAKLDRTRVPSTVRLTRGRDIEAACGQLATAPKSDFRFSASRHV
jgi:adenine C2-methylase RlmN of 23S rRNA A2503 and tRNA A37